MKLSTAAFFRFRDLIALGSMALAIGGSAAADEDAALSRNYQSFQRDMMTSMERMDRAMSSAPMTGDPDHDFAAMMIPHHQGAIDMAKIELLYGKDPVLRRLAQEIIITQQQEIQVMQLKLKNAPGNE